MHFLYVSVLHLFISFFKKLFAFKTDGKRHHGGEPPPRDADGGIDVACLANGALSHFVRVSAWERSTGCLAGQGAGKPSNRWHRKPPGSGVR